MKKNIIILLCFFCFAFNILIVPVMAISHTLKKGFYTVDDLNLSPDTSYVIQNPSFSDRIYILIFDSKATPLQGIRLKPQSQKYNLIPLKSGYKFAIIGDGEILISPK